ncbi:hypothetical protein BDY24DRAFT_143633 [Mrakia frigida]|uniref:uncharacterized protein n=1 Tax=Mrakia frigida TaxID=29902 RepID=UPI003FCBFBCA
MQFSRPCLVNPRLLDRLAGSARAGSPSILRPTGPPPSSPSSFLPPKPAFSYPFVARSLPNPPSKKETPGEGTHTSPRWSKALQNDRRPPAAPPLNLQPSDFPPYLPPPTSVRIEDHDVESVFAPIVKAGWQLERGLGGGDGMQEVVYLSKTVKGGGWAEQLDLLATFNAIFQLHNVRSPPLSFEKPGPRADSGSCLRSLTAPRPRRRDQARRNPRQTHHPSDHRSSRLRGLRSTSAVGINGEGSCFGDEFTGCRRKETIRFLPSKVPFNHPTLLPSFITVGQERNRCHLFLPIPAPHLRLPFDHFLLVLSSSPSLRCSSLSSPSYRASSSPNARRPPSQRQTSPSSSLRRGARRWRTVKLVKGRRVA